MKFSVKDFFNKCDQIRSFLWIWSYLLKNPKWKTQFFVQRTKSVVVYIFFKFLVLRNDIQNVFIGDAVRIREKK